MIKFLIPIAAAASAVAIAAPASAQWSQQPYVYGQHNPYQQPYGYAYGYNNMGQARALQVRINRIQRDLRHLASRRMISRSEYRSLLQDSRELERRFRRHRADGFGLTPREMYDVQARIQRIEYKIARDIRDGRQWGYRW